MSANEHKSVSAKTSNDEPVDVGHRVNFVVLLANFRFKKICLRVGLGCYSAHLTFKELNSPHALVSNYLVIQGTECIRRKSQLTCYFVSVSLPST